MTRKILFLLFFLPFQVFCQTTGYEKSTRVDTIGGREFLVHQVLKGQTLYAISKLYEVPIDSIYQFNPAIKEGIKWGQSIRIPLPVKKPAPTPPAPLPEKVTIKNTDTIVLLTSASSCEEGKNQGPFQIALMMPLYLKEIDSIPNEIPDKTTSLDQIRPFRFIHFYEGVRMALDSVSEMDISVSFYVYDLDDDTLKASKLLKKEEFRKMDLIIGLLYGKSFQTVARYGKENNIPVINPLSNKVQFIENNPMAVLANPTVITMGNQIADYFLKHYTNDRIIILSSSKESEIKSMKLIKSELDKEFEKLGMKGDIYLFTGIKEMAKVETILSNSVGNIIFLISSDELFVASLMGKLKSWASNHSVTVFGMPGWLDFKAIESEDLVKLNFYTFNTCFPDYSVAETQKFVAKFRKEYKAEPQDLAFQGFDVTYYLLSALQKFGTDFIHCLPNYEYQGLQTRFVFQRVGENGYENTWLNIFKLEDYQLMNARD